jgi:release factor glutamine methyltransferase
MNLKETYKNFLLQLQTVYGASEASVITNWVFEHDASVKRADIIRSPNGKLSEAAVLQLQNHLAELLQHKPVQYVLGEAWFYNMKLKVNEHVLIPRPETEELVELILSIAKKQPPNIAILDIGTGSGCISIALKKHLHAAVITAIDVSGDALTVAKQNATNQNMHIEFKEVDFLDETKWGKLPVFDVLVSNPPYIPVNEKEKMRRNVTEYEPASALFVPDNTPLLFYEKIAAFGKEHLNYNGKIFVETHENFAEKTVAVFKAANYTYVDVKKDLYGKDRIVMARN